MLILILLHCRSIAFITFEFNISILWQNFIVQFRKSKMINLDKDLNGSVLSFNHSTKLQFSTIICLNCTSPHIHRNQIKARFMTFFCHFHQQFSMMDCWDSQGWDELLPTSHSAPSRTLECNCSVPLPSWLHDSMYRNHPQIYHIVLWEEEEKEKQIPHKTDAVVCALCLVWRGAMFGLTLQHAFSDRVLHWRSMSENMAELKLLPFLAPHPQSNRDGLKSWISRLSPQQVVLQGRAAGEVWKLPHFFLHLLLFIVRSACIG